MEDATRLEFLEGGIGVSYAGRRRSLLRKRRAEAGDRTRSARPRSESDESDCDAVDPTMSQDVERLNAWSTRSSRQVR